MSCKVRFHPISEQSVSNSHIFFWKKEKQFMETFWEKMEKLVKIFKTTLDSDAEVTK